MGKKLLIVGAGGHGRCCLDIAKSMQIYDNFAYLDDQWIGNVVNDVPIIGSIDEMSAYYGEYEDIFIAIGNHVMRKKSSRKAKEIGYTLVNLIHPNVVIMDATMGEGCVCFPGVVIESQASIKDGCILTANCVINHDAVLEDYVLVYSNTTIRPHARIGAETRIGSNCCIEMNTIVSAGSDIASGTIQRQEDTYGFEVGV